MLITFLFVVVVSLCPPQAQLGVLRSRPGHESCYSWGAFACFTKVFILEVSPANIIGLNSIPSTYLHPKGTEGSFITQQIIHKTSSMTQIIFYHFWQSNVICHLKDRKISTRSVGKLQSAGWTGVMFSSAPPEMMSRPIF